MAIVLFIDDDQNLLDGIARSLRREKFTIVCCQGVGPARQRLEAGGIDVVVSDESMPGSSGSDFMAEVCERFPTTMRIMLTGNATIGSAARAVNGGGIFRYLVKPCSHTELGDTVREALAQKALLDRCRLALGVLQRQDAVLKALERLHPGLVSQAASAESPGVQQTLVAETDLMERMDVAIVRASAIVRG